MTFKVNNGSWDDETTMDKTVTLIGLEGVTLKLTENQIPAVGASRTILIRLAVGT